MWIDLLENHGEAADTVSQLAAQVKTSTASATTTSSGSGYSNGHHTGGVDDDLSDVFTGVDGVEKQKQMGLDAVATLQASMQTVSNLLSSLEEMLRERVLGNAAEDPAGGASMAALEPSPSSGRKSQQQQQTQNSLDAYLNGAAIEEDPVFVNAVRGWDTTSAPVHVEASAPEVLVLDGVGLHDAILQKRRRIDGMHVSHAYNTPNDGQAQPARHSSSSRSTHASSNSAAANTVEERAKKRKRTLATSPSLGQQEDGVDQYHDARHTISPRRLRKTIATLTAEKVIRYRDGNHLCSYLVKYDELDDPVWVLRKQCAPQAQQVIDDFNKWRLAARNKMNRRRAGDAAGKHQSVATTRGAADGDDDSDEGDIYIVDKIVGHRMRYGKKQYFVKWDGYDSSGNTWEAASKLQDDIADVVDAYERNIALAEEQDPQAAALSTEFSSGHSLSNGVVLQVPSNSSSSTGSQEKSTHRHVRDMGQTKRRRKHRAVMVKSALMVADDDDDDSDGDVEILSGHDDDHDSDGKSTIDLENEIVIVDSDDSALSD